MILNMGTNFLLGTISFVSNSVTNILQLALSLDYAIIFCNHFKEEHETLPLKEAVIESLAKSIPEISSSSLTTIGGLVAMLFMQFKIGPDMAICLIKAILFSMCPRSRSWAAMHIKPARSFPSSLQWCWCLPTISRHSAPTPMATARSRRQC